MIFNLLIHDDISVAELIAINENGGRVLKTPHIGNIYPNNLAFISLNIPTLLYDRTIGLKDEKFHPHELIYNGAIEQISNPDILSTHSRVKYQPKSFNLKKDFVGEKIVDLHMSVLRQAIPHGDFFTYTQYIEDNKEIILKIVKEIAKAFPQLWYRFVEEDGTTRKITNPTSEQIIIEGIFGIDNDLKGWIIPNPVNILLHTTVDVIKFKTKDIYLLSGPDMYTYMKDYETILESMYGYIKKTLNLDLPGSVNCYIIPAMNMRFIVTKDDKNILNELVKLYKDYESIDKTIQNLFSGSERKISIKSLVKERDWVKTKILEHLYKNYFVLKKTMFYDISESNCFTQYDLVRSSELYIHPWAIENKLKNVSTAFLFLNRCFRTIEKIKNPNKQEMYVNEI